MLPAPIRVMNVQPARLTLGVQFVDKAKCVVARGRRAQLHADRVPDPGKEVDVGVVKFARALPDPEEMRRGVIRETGPGIDAGQCALVVQQQGFVAGEEFPPA